MNTPYQKRQFKDIVIAAEDLDCHTIDTIADVIHEHIIDIGLATSKTLVGFSWRLDVRVSTSNES
tara:strand:+ start:266 stop:460 length:195 start_codon:yes stop_codon:yes gene_type:complete